MGEVVRLPRPCVVELWDAMLTRTIVHSQHGVRSIEVPNGIRRYFVDVVDNDGSRFGLWDGNTYDQAMKEALAIQRDWAPARLVDLVGGAA